jgi:hypothetical protein
MLSDKEKKNSITEDPDYIYINEIFGTTDEDK